jgi:hypothetical protein
MVHEVLATPATEGYMKLFMGFRLTSSTAPLFRQPDLGLPKIPSSQVPPLYSKMHGSALKKKTFDSNKPAKRKGHTPKHRIVTVEGGLVGWSKQFHPSIERKGGVVPRFLADFKLDLPPYEPLDDAIYKGMPRACSEWLAD